MSEHTHGIGDSPYFFLSYARIPRYDLSDPRDPNTWFHKLYKDLCATVMEFITGKLPGFMDRDLHVGAEWQRKISEAIANCRVFVPLYSDRYFDSDFCGREWSAFAMRVLGEKARNPDISVAIVPALWVPVEEENLPNVAKEIQFNHHDFGERYSSEGFYGIIKTSRYRHDYVTAVHKLAKRIVEVARETSLSPGRRLDIMSLPDAFHGGIGTPTGTGLTGGTGGASGTGGTGGAGGTVPAPDGADMHLTVVAPDISNLPAGRTPIYYGPRQRDWRPYLPDARQPITDYAAGLTAYFGCRPSVGTFEEHDRNVLNGQGVPGLYIIDAWAATRPSYRRQLKRVDDLDEHWTSVLLPWNQSDQETTAAERELRRTLSTCIGRKLADIPYKYRDLAVDIKDLDEFAYVMTGMAMKMLRRFLQSAPAHPPEGDSGERPTLRPPGGEE